MSVLRTIAAVLRVLALGLIDGVRFVLGLDATLSFWIDGGLSAATRRLRRPMARKRAAVPSRGRCP